MTKVNRISNDLLEFLDEDTGISESFHGDLAVKKFNELQSKAVDTKAQDQKAQSYSLNLFWDLVQNNIFDDTDFIEFAHNTESKSLQIATGRKIFNETKYNAKVKDRENKMRSLIDRYNSIISNRDLDIRTQERTTLEIMREFNAIKQTVINKSEKEFHEPEFETLEISAEEAIEIVRNIKSNYDLKCKTDIENRLVVEIEKDRDRFKDISEDDFKFIKRLQRLTNQKAFFEMFEHLHYSELRAALLFDSLEEYFNRDRDIKSDVQLVLTNTEMSAVRYVHEIHKMYNDQNRTNKLKQNLVSMVKSLKES